MGLLSFFKRKENPPRPAASADAVAHARTKARQRLIGAVVLLGIGIIGFPLLFETQPRPIPVDIPIDIPRKEAAPPLAMPPARAPARDSASGTAAVRSPTPTSAIITEPSDDQQPARPAAAPAAPASAAVVAKPSAPATPPTAKVAVSEPKEAKPAKEAKEAKEPKEPKEAKQPAKEHVAAAPKSSKEDASRAQALLDGKNTAASDDGRFVVQVGAFSENSAAHEARVKVERLGLKTYTQVVETASGKRIRVRVGPFASRDQAREAADKIKASGLPSAVLTL